VLISVSIPDGLLRERVSVNQFKRANERSTVVKRDLPEFQRLLKDNTKGSIEAAPVPVDLDNRKMAQSHKDVRDGSAG